MFDVYLCHKITQLGDNNTFTWLVYMCQENIYVCKSETRHVPTNLAGTKNKAQTGTDK